MNAAKKPRRNRRKKSGAGLANILMVIYTVGFLFTTTWYVVRGFRGCEARTIFGRCLDFGLMVEAGFHALIWPLHWLLELIEAVAGGSGKPGG